MDKTLVSMSAFRFVLDEVMGTRRNMFLVGQAAIATSPRGTRLMGPSLPSVRATQHHYHLAACIRFLPRMASGKMRIPCLSRKWFLERKDLVFHLVFAQALERFRLPEKQSCWLIHCELRIRSTIM